MNWYSQFLKRFGFVGILLTALSLAYIVLFLLFGILGADGFNALFLKISLPVNVDTAINQPWSILSYWLVAHPMQFWFLLVDLVVLYAFGHILNALIGDRRTQVIVLLAIVGNALVTIALCNLLPTVEVTAATRLAGFGSISAALIAAAITLVPRYNFKVLFWDVPLISIGLFMLLFSIVTHRAIFTMAGTSEISGALIGFLTIKFMRSGWDLKRWFQGAANRPQPAIPRQPEPVFSNQKPVVIRAVNPKQKAANPQQQAPELSEEEELDLLLDKINEVGYAGLSPREKERLDKLSGKD